MKICIERSDRMGDMILTLPVIQGIKQKNPQAIIHVIASQKNSKICMQYNLIDKIFEKSKLSFNNLIKSISAEKYDYYYSFSPGWFGLRLGFFSKSKFKSSLIASITKSHDANELMSADNSILDKIFRISDSLIIFFCDCLFKLFLIISNEFDRTFSSISTKTTLYPY